MKRGIKIALAVVGLLALVSGLALARQGHEGFGKRRLLRHVDQALDAVNATQPQRDAVHAAVEHVQQTFADNAQSRQADLQEALTLWQADRIDPAALGNLRARHQAAAKKLGDAIVQAISDAHDALTAPQRAQLVTYLKAHRPPKMDGAKPWVKHMVSERVDDMLDEINATQAQRDTVHAAVQRAFDTITADDPTGHFDQAIELFAADKIDAAKIAQLQGEHQAKAQKLGDAIVDAITRVHDALTPAQRSKVAEIVQQHHMHHHGG